MSSAYPAHTVVQSYWVLQLRGCIWYYVSVLTSCFFFSSHNLIKHETHLVKLKIDFPFSFSDKEEKTTLSGAQRYRQNTL